MRSRGKGYPISEVKQNRAKGEMNKARMRA